MRVPMIGEEFSSELIITIIMDFVFALLFDFSKYFKLY